MMRPWSKCLQLDALRWRSASSRYDLEVPQETLKLRVSSPERKKKESATIVGRESTTSKGKASGIARCMTNMQGHAWQDNKPARAHRGHSTGAQMCSLRARTGMARPSSSANMHRVRTGAGTHLRSDTCAPLLQGIFRDHRASAAGRRTRMRALELVRSGAAAPGRVRRT